MTVIIVHSSKTKCSTSFTRPALVTDRALAKPECCRVGRSLAYLVENDMCPIVIGERAWKRHTEVSLGPYRSRRLRYGPRLTEVCLFQGCTTITIGHIILYKEFVCKDNLLNTSWAYSRCRKLQLQTKYNLVYFNNIISNTQHCVWHQPFLPYSVSSIFDPVEETEQLLLYQQYIWKTKIKILSIFIDWSYR